VPDRPGAGRVTPRYQNVTRPHRVLVFGGSREGGEGLRARVARGRPNWWVILAVSLGLMALLVATAGSAPSGSRRGDHPAQTAARISPPGSHGRTGTSPVTTTTPTATTTTAAGTALGRATIATSLGTTGTSGAVSAPQSAAPSVTATTVAPAPTSTTTTTTVLSVSVPADRTQTQGYLNPPLQPSNKYGFTGAGAMEISVVWSGSTYLTMEVSCPSGDESVGGTSAMAASLPDASGSCLATVTEPTSETTSLTYTISIGPAGG